MKNKIERTTIDSIVKQPKDIAEAISYLGAIDSGFAVNTFNQITKLVLEAEEDIRNDFITGVNRLNEFVIKEIKGDKND